MLEQLDGFVTILFMLLVLVGILALAYFTTRFIAGRYQGGTGNHDIRVLDRVAVDQNASLLLVQVAEETFLLGATGQHIEKICQVDASKLTAKAPLTDNPLGGKTFAGILKGLAPQKSDPMSDEEKP